MEFKPKKKKNENIVPPKMDAQSINFVRVMQIVTTSFIVLTEQQCLVQNVA